MKDKGFTLIEVMIVVAIIGILAGVTVPFFNKTSDLNKRKQAIQNFYEETDSTPAELDLFTRRLGICNSDVRNVRRLREQYEQWIDEYITLDEVKY